jgi:hypothetical protein
LLYPIGDSFNRSACSKYGAPIAPPRVEARPWRDNYLKFGSRCSENGYPASPSAEADKANSNDDL